MKHIPVIFQHQKCKAAGTEASILNEVVLKNTETVQQLGSKRSEDLKAASIIHAKIEQTSAFQYWISTPSLFI